MSASTLDLRLGSCAVRVSDRDLLGVGGEARVFRFRDLAVKVFHPGDAAALAARIEKIRRFAAYAGRLPAEVIAPRAIVTDPRGAPVGYAMPLIPHSTPVACLAQRTWRERVVTNGEVVALFGEIHRVLGAIHRAGVVVGDFNDGNVLFAGSAPAFIDADSMQIGGLPCVVAHERFLDPRLFGVDLGRAPVFQPANDWYAFAVLLFASLLYVHPYGGVHKRLPTMLRRAEARHSVLCADVVWPHAAAPLHALPDDLLDWFAGVFDRDRRDPLPSALLAPGAWRRCRCGLEHARATCPACSAHSGAPVKTTTRIHGRCVARTVFRTRGRLLDVAPGAAGELFFAHEDEGIVRREDGARVLEQRLLPGMRFAISGTSTWIAHGRRLVRVHREHVVERADTGELAGLPVFAATPTTCFRTDGEQLVDGARGMRVGRVLEGQTWIWAGGELGFGLYRAGLLTFFFLFKEGRAGLTHVALPELGGRLAEARAIFDTHEVLVLLGTEKNGAGQNAMFLVKDDGTVAARAVGHPDDARALASLRGKALVGGRVLAATDDGLVLLEAAHGQLVERAHFPDTAPFVGTGVDLLPGPGGSVYVITAKEITHLEMTR